LAKLLEVEYESDIDDPNGTFDIGPVYDFVCEKFGIDQLDDDYDSDAR